MIDSVEFIKESREIRRSHLNLDEPCCERGGTSTQHKGVLAQYLTTTIPSGRILLCHACHNAKCSNPVHLYWGTDKDNLVIDRAEQPGGHKTPWQRMLEKYGPEEAYRMQKENASKGASLGGKARKGKQLSEEHKKKIADSVKRKYNTKNNAPVA
jgi:hypothetical protein